MKYFPLLLAMLLAGCGTLPEPFYGNPGATAARLAMPPAPVLVVPAPNAALLGDDDARVYAGDLAVALAAADVPSITRAATKQDWQINTTARLNGDDVTPHYVITGPGGKNYGGEDGANVPAAGWANGDASVLQNAANADSLTLAKLLAGINASVQQSNPDSLENRPPRLFIAGVSGAPGDGDSALPLDLSRDLPPLGLVIVQQPAQADFTINGVVKSQPDANSQILVEIDWIIHDANHRNTGQVTQLHDLNPSDISPYWGDVAAAAATEAAGGIHEAVSNAVLKKGK